MQIDPIQTTPHSAHRLRRLSNLLQNTIWLCHP